MEYIRVTKDNLETEHICCAIANNKDIQVSSKKAWLADRFDEGLVFIKSAERGKCFVEFIPAENAWNPIEAPDYTSTASGYRVHSKDTVILRSFLRHALKTAKKKERRESVFYRRQRKCPSYRIPGS